MIDLNGIVRTPVSPEEVASILGETGGDIGTVCTSSRINQWSRIKPIYNSSKGVDPDDVDDFMKANNFGFVADENRGLFGNGLRDFVLYGRSNPEYASPGFIQGGDIGPCRLLDFNGYNHNTKSAYPVYADFIYVNTTDDPDKLYVQFKVDENTPIQMREFSEILPYATAHEGGWRYVVVIDKTGDIGSSESDFDVVIGHEVFNSANLDYYHMQSPIANEILEIDMSAYTPATIRVVAGMMRINYTASGPSYGRTMIIWNGGYMYQRTSPVSVSLQPIYRGFGEDSSGLSEMRFSLQAGSGVTLSDFSIVVNFYHYDTDVQEYYNAGASVASPVSGAYAMVDLTGAPTRVQYTDYATVQYSYRENGVLNSYYFDFRNQLVSPNPYPKQKIL